MKRAGAQRIPNDFQSEEESSAEKVVEREQVEENPKMYLKDEEEIAVESIKSLPQEGILSETEECNEMPEISGDISVTEGLQTEVLKIRVTPKTKETVIMTGSESNRRNAVVGQGDPASQKSQENEFPVQKSDSPTANVEIKHIKRETTTAFQLSVRKPELPSVADSVPLDKNSLQKTSKPTDQEEKPLSAESIETTSKTLETRSSEAVKLIDLKVSPKQIVESKEAEEKLCVTPKSATQTSVKKPVRLSLDSPSSQLTYSQSKGSELVETEEKLLENMSYKAENEKEDIHLAVSKGIPKKEKRTDKADSLEKKTLDKKPAIQELTPVKDVTDKELLEGETPEKLMRTDEHIRDVRITDKLQKTEKVYKKKTQPSKQKEQTVEVTGDREFDDLQMRGDTEKEQDMKQEEQGRMEGKASVKPVMELMLTRQEHTEEQSSVEYEQDEVPKQTTLEHYTPEQYTKEELLTKAGDAGNKENYVQVEDIPPSRPIHFKEREQTLKDTKVQEEMVTAEDKQPNVPPAEERKTGQKEAQPQIVEAEDKRPNVAKTEEQEHPERMAEKIQELAKPEETAQSIQSSFHRVKGKYSEVTLIEETQPRLRQTKRQSPVKEVEEMNPEELQIEKTKTKESITESDAISPKKEETAKERYQILHKKGKAEEEPSTDKQKKSERTEEVGRKGLDKTVETLKTSAPPEDTKQKPGKPRDIIVEQDQLKISTVKDKNSKVTPLKEKKSKQEEIKRKVSVTPMMEETSEELEVADNTPKEKLKQNLIEATEVADEKISSKFIPVKEEFVKVTSPEDETPKPPERQVKRKKSDGDVKSDTPQTYITPDELVKDTASRKEKLCERQEQMKRKALAASEQGIANTKTEVQSEAVIANDDTPFQVTDSKQEFAFEKHFIVKNVDAESNMLQKSITPGTIVKDISSRNEDIYESHPIPSPDSTKESVGILTEDTQVTDVTNQFKTDETETPKESLIEQDALERQLELAKPKEMMTEKMIGKDKIIKEFHDSEKTEIKATVHEQIKREQFVTLTKKIESQEIVVKELSSQKHRPAMKESKTVIDCHEPTAREPSVIDRNQAKMIEKKTSDNKPDSPEYREDPTREWKSDIDQSFLKAGVQYIPPQEVETISRKEGEASIIEMRVLSLDPEGKEHVSFQQPSRGIQGKMLYVTEHVFLS